MRGRVVLMPVLPNGPPECSLQHLGGQPFISEAPYLCPPASSNGMIVGAVPDQIIQVAQTQLAAGLVLEDLSVIIKQLLASDLLTDGHRQAIGNRKETAI